ncbi:RNA polymerase sigma factor [Neorhodopirellula pilleata]|uniref:ECF RNA polymerase sigma factor SigW n=1 Tax=Neorhodopirellula pilleata TaxID=2714738 RepID=A0A5C6A8T7_9BACT|nr:RNA polymerase sigma factor [Neorhodopirellula pilleata]TWT96384.1 ECF RNA polymerase sigma factor SigW [Neorhodopirellula pilleata]
MSVSSDPVSTFACHGESTAVAELFGRHREMVYRVCMRFLGHHHDAEDVTQETFHRAAASINRWDPQRPIEPWLATIAGNRCRTLLSRRRRETNVQSIDELPANLLPIGTADSTSSESSVVLDEWLHHALAELPDHQRRAFELIHRDNLSYPQAADRMGRSTGTIKTWVRRARMLVRERGRREGIGILTASVASILFVVFGWFTPEPTAVTQLPAGHLLHSSGPAGESSVSTEVDWQYASLQAFSVADIDFESIEMMPAGAIPIELWIEQTSPILGELQQGVAPVGRTLRNVFMLFTYASPTVYPTSNAADTSDAVGDLDTLPMSDFRQT